MAGVVEVVADERDKVTQGHALARVDDAEVQRQIEQVKHRLAKTRIASPINEVVPTKDLQSRVREVLPVGGRFCGIADLSRWDSGRGKRRGCRATGALARLGSGAGSPGGELRKAAYGKTSCGLRCRRHVVR